MRRIGRLEVAFFILLIVILAAVAIPRYFKVLAQTRERQVEANASLLQLRLEEFARETGGFYPMDFKTSVRDFNPEAERDFTLEEVLDEAHENPYLGGKEDVFELAPLGTADFKGRPGVVFYAPGTSVEDSSPEYATDYRILGFGKKGERLDFELREEGFPP
jgi:type II secretory pathway pseudopilin PulG